MPLTETDKDRVAETLHRARAAIAAGDPRYWTGGDPEGKLANEMAALGPESADFALSLIGQDIARLDERGTDPVTDRIDAADGGSVPRDEAEGTA